MNGGLSQSLFDPAVGMPKASCDVRTESQQGAVGFTV